MALGKLDTDKEVKMRKRRHYFIRTFRCPKCQKDTYASKCKGKTPNGHLKVLWCPWCGFDGDMEQVEIQEIRR